MAYIPQDILASTHEELVEFAHDIARTQKEDHNPSTEVFKKDLAVIKGVIKNAADRRLSSVLITGNFCQGVFILLSKAGFGVFDLPYLSVGEAKYFITFPQYADLPAPAQPLEPQLN